MCINIIFVPSVSKLFLCYEHFPMSLSLTPAVRVYLQLFWLYSMNLKKNVKQLCIYLYFIVLILQRCLFVFFSVKYIHFFISNYTIIQSKKFHIRYFGVLFESITVLTKLHVQNRENIKVNGRKKEYFFWV